MTFWCEKGSKLALSQKADKKKAEIRISLPPFCLAVSTLLRNIGRWGKKGVFEWKIQPQDHFVSVCHL